MKINILDKDGFYLGDHVEGDSPEFWTVDLVGDGYYKPQYQCGYTSSIGEFTEGVWVETGGLSEEDKALIKSMVIKSAKGTKASKMAAATGIINTLQDAVDAGVASKEESLSLPLWKEYRLALYRVDANIAPDITWPVTPDELPVVIEEEGKEPLMEPVAKVKFSM